MFGSGFGSQKAAKDAIRLYFAIIAAVAIMILSGTLARAASADTARWWDKFGKPQYGGEINVLLNSKGAVSFDNYSIIGADNQYWFESLWANVNWTVDRKEWSYNTDFSPEKYCSAYLAESWSYSDPRTIVVKIRKGVHWQNKPPVNGREFTASDVEAHYDRVLGTGHGFTAPAPMYKGMIPNLERAVAVDKYTVKFIFKERNAFGLASLMDQISINEIEAPEWVALGGPPVKPAEPKGAQAGPPPAGPPGPPPLSSGPLQDWKNAVGTGAWILTDYMSGTHMIYSKNPDYWGYDERYPENRLPYADKLNLIVIQDLSTQIAALRTKKIDMLRDVPWQQAASIRKTNPKLQYANVPSIATAIGLRNDAAPFSDIRVRKALQMSLDLKMIAKGYYGGTVDGNPAGLIAPSLKGYAYDYKDWPQSLKDEYAYNPSKAKKLLAEAGFPNGFKTNLVASTNDDRALLELIKSYFKGINVDMDIKMMDYGAWRAFQGAGKHDQMVTWGFGPQAPSILVRYSIKNSSQNPLFINDPEYDNLAAEFYSSDDPDGTRKMAQAADRMGLEKHYAVSIFPPVTTIFWQPYLKCYSGETQLRFGATYLYSRIFVDQKLKK